MRAVTHVMIIAGTDSSGGAGLTRDVATAQVFGCGVLPVVTAVTVQTHVAVRKIVSVSPEIVTQQIGAAFDSARPKAVKIGMLGSAETARAVAEALAERDIPIVLDPVLRASSGGVLSAGADLHDIMAIGAVLTPNLIEASELSQTPLAQCDDALRDQANLLLGSGAEAVLIKGGHGAGTRCVDHLFEGGQHHRFDGPRLRHGRRGTGCTLATAIACELAHGAATHDACRSARAYVQQWIEGSF